MLGILNMRMVLVAGIALLAFALLAGGAFAKNDGGTRPGWGFGDKNHEHTGPPGQSVSVNPVNDDDHEDENDDEDDDRHGSNHGNHDDDSDDD